MPTEPDQSDSIEIHDSRLFYASWCVAMAILAVVSATIPVWGPIGMFIFGFHSVWALRRLFDRRPRILMTSEGIVDHNFWYSPGLIRWEEIIDVHTSGLGLVEVHLKDEVAFWERLSPLRQMARYKLQLLGFGPALITPWGLDRSAREVVEMLQAGLDEYVLQSTLGERSWLGDGGPETGRLPPR